MDDAVARGANFVGGKGEMGVSSSGGYQFINTTVDANGNTVTRIARFDVNPSSGHVQSCGPHLNLEVQINGKKMPGDPHVPIAPSTIRPGDVP